ncbi:MAG: M12 family metallo-peptidase, partial [Bacteroidota bacterium]
MKKAIICTILILCLGNIYAQLQVSLKTITNTTNIDLRKHYKAHTLVRLDYEGLYQEHLQNEADIHFQLLGFANDNLAITISPKDMRGAKYIKQIGEGARSQRLGKSRTATYQGIVQGDTGGNAYFTIDRQFLLANWEVAGEKYYLDPLWLIDPTADRDIYVLYREADAIIPNDFCAVDDPAKPAVLHQSSHDDKKGGPEKAGECYTVEIALAADFELFQELGNNEASVENFMLNNLMDVQTDYDDAFADEIQFEVAATYIATCSNTSCDPWTNSPSPFDVLDDFAIWGNAGNFGAIFDVATLWSGRDFTSSTIGLAAVGAVCTPSRYNTCERFSSSSVLLRVLLSHELGHNFNSGHDDPGGFIMSRSVNPTSNWSNQSTNAINNFIPTRNCLDNCPLGGPPIAFAEASNEEVCTGSYIAFFDDSEGSITNRFWDFEGGVPATSTDQHPIVFFPDPGSYTVSLNVDNAEGGDFASLIVDVAQDNNFTKVLHFENFENGFGDWGGENPDNNIGWGITSVGGNLGDQAAFVNNFEYDAAGQTDALISPFFDLSGQTGVRFSFEYAYVRYNGSFNDELVVSLSTNGGTTFPNILFEGAENGSGNFATAPDNLNAFIPNANSDWCGAGPGG